jgi:hypothetical protein
MLNFAHWMRVLCTLLLARGTEASIRKSLEYAEAAAELVNEHGQSYSENEVYAFCSSRYESARTVSSLIPRMSIFGSWSLVITRALNASRTLGIWQLYFQISSDSIYCSSNLIPLAKRWLEAATILSKHRESGDLPSYVC